MIFSCNICISIRNRNIFFRRKNSDIVFKAFFFLLLQNSLKTEWTQSFLKTTIIPSLHVQIEPSNFSFVRKKRLFFTRLNIFCHMGGRFIVAPRFGRKGAREDHPAATALFWGRGNGVVNRRKKVFFCVGGGISHIHYIIVMFKLGKFN